MRTPRLSTNRAHVAASRLVPFTTHGALRGAYVTAGSASELGRLPDAWRAVFATAVRDHGRALYVVWSYGTPIAWAYRGGTWVRPPVSYSVTTSRHAGQTPQHGTKAPA